jgi:hypothetical protein
MTHNTAQQLDNRILTTVIQQLSINKRLSLEHSHLFWFCVFSDDASYPYIEATERRSMDFGDNGAQG